jgi:hypothetical protein
VRYSYLWHGEHVRGREEGIKDRPCAIVLAIRGRDGTRVLLLPVTHRAPANDDEAVEIPPVIKRRLGLDDERSWIILSEWNECTWPSSDLRPTAYGFLPPRFFDHVRRRFAALVESRKARRVKRIE